MGALIGEGGKTISRIRSEANVTMKLDPSEDLRGAATPTRKVIITGTESCCLKARAMVQEVMRSDTAMARRDSSAGQYAADEKSSEAGSTLVRLTIARHLVGKVIGTRGATVKKLRETTGAVIEINKDESGTGTITLSGAPAAVREAREQIAELTAEDLPIEVQQTLSRMLDEVLVLNVPANRVGKVIGSRGAVIQGLRQETGVTIDLQKDETGAAIVTLRGSMEAMRSARAAIENIVLAEDAKSTAEIDRLS